MQKNETNTEALARRLWLAAETHRQIDPFPEAALTLEAAWAVAELNRRRAERDGAEPSGWKIGLTSAALRQSLSAAEPDCGRLYRHNQAQDNIPAGALLQPKVEAELAFVLARDLEGPGVTAAQVLAATGYVTPALEIVDTRVRDWRATLPEMIADNGCAGMYVLSAHRLSPAETDLAAVSAALYQNGQLLAEGTGQSVMEGPANSVAWLANWLHGQGQHLRAGEVILSGALLGAHPAAPGDRFTAAFSGIGEVGVTFGPAPHN